MKLVFTQQVQDTERSTKPWIGAEKGYDRERQKLIEKARRIYVEGSNDDIEIDDNAETSEPGDPELGTWVQAWVFVPKNN